MTKSDASIANRVLLFCFIAICTSILWFCGVGAIAKHTGIVLSLNGWVGLSLGAAVLADRAYVKLFPVADDEKSRD